MRLLLDTQVALWWLAGPSGLRRQAALSVLVLRLVRVANNLDEAGQPPGSGLLACPLPNGAELLPVGGPSDKIRENLFSKRIARK